ncbi:MAG: M15 family metallopeptidase [Bacteroidota bacterium]|nr:M15 family metallopeptidase [Bacteroidota bacterium]
MKYSIKSFITLFLPLLVACNQSDPKPRVKATGSDPVSKSIGDTSSYRQGEKMLLSAYPDFIADIKGNVVVFKDGTSMKYDDSITNKDWDQLLNSPSIKDQFTIPYVKGPMKFHPKKNEDPGRIRNEDFFKKMYGKTEKAVKKNLVEIAWLPNTLHQKVEITSVNKVNEKLSAISAELDKFPSLAKYVSNIGGTFKWRFIKGTKRLSEHSFGIAIDINTSLSNYWMWDCKCADEKDSIGYINRIPFQIVSIFEKYGFIWGGKWYHYDTMHFEYRPELN